MRILMTILGLCMAISSIHAIADEHLKKPTCLEQVAKNEKWKVLTDTQLSCITSYGEFIEGMIFLCLKDGSDISAEYQKDLEYKQKEQAAFEKFKTAPDVVSRQLAVIELKNIRQDWSLLGFKHETSKALNLISHAHFQCTQD